MSNETFEEKFPTLKDHELTNTNCKSCGWTQVDMDKSNGYLTCASCEQENQELFDRIQEKNLARQFDLLTIVSKLDLAKAPEYSTSTCYGI